MALFILTHLPIYLFNVTYVHIIARMHVTQIPPKRLNVIKLVILHPSFVLLLAMTLFFQGICFKPLQHLQSNPSTLPCSYILLPPSGRLALSPIMALSYPLTAMPYSLSFSSIFLYHFMQHPAVPFSSLSFCPTFSILSHFQDLTRLPSKEHITGAVHDILPRFLGVRPRIAITTGLRENVAPTSCTITIDLTPGIPRLAFFDAVTPICTEILTEIYLGLRKQSHIGQLADAGS